MKLVMSCSSSARTSSGTRARWPSMSGRRPAFQESMNSLRIRSRSVVTEDLLQFGDAALAALVDVGQGDVEPFGDLLAVELLLEGQFQHGAVVVVLDEADRPVGELDGGVARGG